VIEARFPLHYERAGFIPDSAGRGRHRGGFGVEKVIRTVADDIRFSSSMERTTNPPWGLDGGGPGRPGGIAVQHPGTREWVPALKVTDLDLARGARVRLRSHGGGGWGDPAGRPATLREADALAGLVTEPDSTCQHG
jgi:N-methylhydantoinase B